ncbi:major paralogous domain-containing protein [Fibrobacter sp. UWCM]|uniref:FISUMP domain-containing protein n=1 Tax=unclassified Fibrobacter TaxID=2634177 RepID=UPI00091EC5EC|nr:MULTISPECIES: FISUMP domain-containing protein [unclassified Fibrobacter]MBO6135497.1 hypothetical protein [Fibrobacter sp.]MBQ9224633.1 hypothetical protein [Fibrobacter sp.]SHG69615.1 major paralogous domain-containing protein [Fibrobacter sp. UWCM]
MKRFFKSKIVGIAALAFGLAFLVGCGDDDDFSPVSGKQGADDVESSDSVKSSSSVKSSDSEEPSSSSVIPASSGDLRSSSSRVSSSSSNNPPDDPASAIEINITTKDDIFNPEIDYGEMTDPRDGKKYKTIEFNGQVWMAENLNYADSTKSTVIKGNTHCYDNDERNCELLGRFYNRTAAMNNDACIPGKVCNLGDEPVQGICPDGWHIPSWKEMYYFDWAVDDRLDYVRSANGWGDGVKIIAPGLDVYGLSFVGMGEYVNGRSTSKGLYSATWAVSESVYSYLLIKVAEQRMYVDDISLEKMTDNFFGVRCIKD